MLAEAADEVAQAVREIDAGKVFDDVETGKDEVGARIDDVEGVEAHQAAAAPNKDRSRNARRLCKEAGGLAAQEREEVRMREEIETFQREADTRATLAYIDGATFPGARQATDEVGHLLAVLPEARRARAA